MHLSERLLTDDSAHTVQLVANIKQKLLDTNDSAQKNTKTALIIGAGAMRGVYSGGVVTALEKLGLTNTFDEVIGISAGAATAAYFLAGQAELGTTIYYEDLTSKKFINLMRPGNMLGINYLGEIFRTVKPLDEKAVYSSRSNFYIGVTDIARAAHEYIRIKHDGSNDIIKLIQASSSVPGLAPPIDIEGTLYSDGVSTCKNPIAFAIELGCTDILYITNQPLRSKNTITRREALSSRVATRGHAPDFKTAYLDRHTMSDETGATTYPANVRIAVLCPEKAPVGRLSKNSAKLRDIAAQAEAQTLKIFG